jgi:hypothetical protein
MVVVVVVVAVVVEVTVVKIGTTAETISGLLLDLALELGLDETPKRTTTLKTVIIPREALHCTHTIIDSGVDAEGGLHLNLNLLQTRFSKFARAA